MTDDSDEQPAENPDDPGWPPPLVVDETVVQRVRSSRVYSAPRRFDLPTIFAVTTAYAILFAVTGALQWSPLASMSLAGFITMIGISQALLFGGQSPRLASVIVGTVISFLWLLGALATDPQIEFLLAAPCTVLTGAMFGYFAGAFVGGVFLIADVLRGRFSRDP